MSFTNRSNSLRTDSGGSSHWAKKIPRALCTAIVLAVLPFSAGCSPEAFVTTLIVAPVLYAHLRQDSPGTKQKPVRASMNEPRIYTSTERANTAYTTSSAPRPQAPDSPVLREVLTDRQPATQQESRSPATARNAGPAPMPDTLPAQRTRPPPNKQPAAVSPIVEGALAYREMRWDDAVRILTGAIDSGTCTDSERSKAHILLGATEYQQGNLQAARVHFMAAHRHDAHTQPSPRLFPPQLVNFYKTVNGLKGP